MTFWLRACPKCGGDLEARREVSGTYVHCVQCGLELTAHEEQSLLRTGRVPRGLPAAPAPPVLVEGRRHSA